MELLINDCVISDDKSKLQIDRICEMLAKSYWASERKRETIEKSIKHSLCFGLYCAGEQIGFARCATDYAVSFMLMDVIIDERFRGRGLGKALVSAVLSHEKLQGLTGTLATRDAHGLYSQFGFSPVDPNYYMKRMAQD